MGTSESPKNPVVFIDPTRRSVTLKPDDMFANVTRR